MHPASMAETTVKVYLAIWRRAYNGEDVEIECVTKSRVRVIKNMLYGAIYHARKYPHLFPDAELLKRTVAVHSKGKKIDTKIYLRRRTPSELADYLQKQLGIDTHELDAVAVPGEPSKQ